MKSILLAAVLTITPSYLAHGQTKPGASSRQSKDEQAVLRLEREWLEALKRKDLAALDRIIADDFLITTADGQRLNKEQDLAPIRDADFKFESGEVEGIEVRVYGSTAVVTGTGIFKGTFKGKPFVSRERFTDIYSKRKGRWQVVASHLSPAK